MISPNPLIFFGSPKGNRTPVSGVRGGRRIPQYFRQFPNIIEFINQISLKGVPFLCHSILNCSFLQLKRHEKRHGVSSVYK